MKETAPWADETTERFVAFFDIMGFKDMVQRDPHEKIREKLQALKKLLIKMEGVTLGNDDKTKFRTRSFTFSDSIVIFTKGKTPDDLKKIVFDSYALLKKALEMEIGIKGSLAFGNITVDFENHLFFGQPIIDAYLLHEELQMYNVIVDNSFEKQVKGMPRSSADRYFWDYKVPLKSGKIIHKLIRPAKKDCEEQIKNLEKIYLTVSGKPRLYIDNTLEFLNSLLKPNKDTLNL